MAESETEAKLGYTMNFVAINGEEYANISGNGWKQGSY